MNKALCGCLLLIVIMSAITVVYIRQTERQLFSQLQKAEKVRDTLSIEWGQLLLEQSTWATQTRIEHIAERRLNMHIPLSQEIIMVKVS